MTQLTDEGRHTVAEHAKRHGVSEDTVTTLLTALQRGGGTQAQFSIPELGGMGQWARGGMVMVGDMFNNDVKARVDALCRDLAEAMQGQSLFATAPDSGSSDGSDWPADLGRPSSEGAQNDMRYAYFPDSQRLAIRKDGKVTVYDTGDHRIGGFGQQQGGSQSLTFTSQHGTVPLSELRKV